ncbi:MAG: hypothetical protein MJY44_02030 [Bacteroidales bacterium]|nr:hypothetical protein [Bacteroidales bacterium]
MILTPKAKPVRIRIESGGIEHSSLSSLKNYFHFGDVFSLCQKGSILRWLEQQNEVVVLSRLNAALAGDSNNEERYNLKIILSFYPEATDSGVKDIKGLILYWMKLDNYFNVSSFLNQIYDKKVLRSLIKNSEERYSDLFKKRLGTLLYLSGEFQEAADLGDKDALRKMKETLPSYTSNYSSEDVASFMELKQIANNQEALNLGEFTQQVKNCALLVSLIQDIISHSEDVKSLGLFLSRDIRIHKKEWPLYLQPYVSYIMWAIQKYLGTEQLKSWAYQISPTFYVISGIFRFNNHELSFAEAALFGGDIEYTKAAHGGIGMLSMSYLEKVNTNNEEAFLIAIDSIKDELLGNK